jgi:hypothetical protein
MITKENIQIQFVKEVIFSIDSQDLEDITKQVYGFGIEMLESPNDTTHQYNIDSFLTMDEKKDVEKAIKNKSMEYWNYSVILKDLYEKGLIEKGKYLVRMSW